MNWLLVTGLLIIFVGLLWVGIFTSRMTVAKDGRFEVVSRSVHPPFLAPKDSNFGVAYRKHRIPQAGYEKALRIASYFAAVFALLTFAVFIISMTEVCAMW